jgi:hypothetical protein
VSAGVGAGVDCCVGFLWGRSASQAALCGCCSAGVAIREVAALLDACTQGCSTGRFAAYLNFWIFF